MMIRVYVYLSVSVLVRLWSLALIDDVQIPDSLQKAKDDFVGELVFELLQAEQLSGTV